MDEMHCRHFYKYYRVFLESRNGELCGEWRVPYYCRRYLLIVCTSPVVCLSLSVRGWSRAKADGLKHHSVWRYFVGFK